MLIDKIRFLVEEDQDEDFDIIELDDKIIIKLEGIQFKTKGEIIINNNYVNYRENNTEYIYNAECEESLLYYLNNLLDHWIDCNSPIGKDDFKKFFN